MEPTTPWIRCGLKFGDPGLVGPEAAAASPLGCRPSQVPEGWSVAIGRTSVASADLWGGRRDMQSRQVVLLDDYQERSTLTLSTSVIRTLERVMPPPRR